MPDRAIAVAMKDLKEWARDPQAMAGPMLIPLVLMFISTVLFGFGGDEWNIGLVDSSKGPHAQSFQQEIRDLDSNISPYFNVVTTDPKEADRLVREGRLQLVVEIPPGFDQAVAEGRTPELRTQTFNINTDMMKNARLRLDRALLDWTHRANPDLAPVTIRQETTRSEDVWRRSFIGMGAVILSIMVGSALNSAIIVAREWERRTSKEIRLAPRAHGVVFTGKLLAGLVAGLVNTLVTAVIAVALFGVRVPWDRVPALALIGGLAALVCAGLGIGIGAWLRDYQAIQPLLLVTFAGTFFAAGGFSSVPTLPPTVRAFDRFWPPAYVFEQMQGWAFMAEAPPLGGFLLGLLVFAALALGFGAFVLRRRT